MDNPFLGGSYLTGGMKLMAADHIGDPYEDWSQVRSHGRAKRRRRMGHPQRIVVRYRANGKMYHLTAENAIVGHPDDIAKVLAKFPGHSR